MSPFLEKHIWFDRKNSKVIEPLKNIYFIYEGQNTEKWYFEELFEQRKNLHIKDNLNFIYIEKTDKEAGCSNYKHLLNAAFKISKKSKFDKRFDKIIVVFDLDVVKRNNAFPELYQQYKNKPNWLHWAVTNPSFEVFLLLHNKNSYKNIFQDNQNEILENRKISQRRYLDKLVGETLNINCKKNEHGVKDLVTNLPIAIKEESYLNQDISKSSNKVTSNIGYIISKMI